MIAPTARDWRCDWPDLDDPLGVHLGPREVECLSPADELDEIELGWRVGWEFLAWEMVRIMDRERIGAARYFSACVRLFGNVARACRDQHKPIPAEWYPVTPEWDPRRAA